MVLPKHLLNFFFLTFFRKGANLLLSYVLYMHHVFFIASPDYDHRDALICHGESVGGTVPLLGELLFGRRDLPSLAVI